MSKIKTTFFCKNCGYESPKWQGKCPACAEWNTFVEEKAGKPGSSKQGISNKEKNSPVPIHEVAPKETFKWKTKDEELNNVLGGGIIPGSLVLIGGEPGIGKSTLMLQAALNIPYKVLYVSGEESEDQIKMRADRIGIHNKECYILNDTSLQSILQQVEFINPDLLIIDSIQTLTSDKVDSTAGSILQIRECAGELQRYSKERNVPVFLIGHITKDGSIAGPKILEHMVDTVLQFEGDRHHTYRILRTLKNRFGSTAEIGIYEMHGSGLKEVKNPSELFMSQKEEAFSGIAIASTMEGLRPLMIEIQALVTPAVYGTPQRSATGFDLRRLSMLLAVLEKRCGFPFGNKDVFLNITGGIKIEDPAIDLPVICALLSSFEDVPVNSNCCFAGEIGLSGEIRAVNKVDRRIIEAEKLGFNKIFISKYNQKIEMPAKGIEIVKVNNVEGLYNQLFG